MSKIFELNMKGGREVLKSAAVGKACLDYASSIANNANNLSTNGGYVAENRNYPTRVGAVVRAGTDDAAIDNAENNTLEKVRPW